MLGHDMRNPLNAILLTAVGLAELNAGEEVSEAAALLIRSGASMRALLDDLIDFNRLNLGLGISVEVGEADLAVLCENELKQHRAANPGQAVELAVTGDVTGRWDGQRLQQVLRNLLSNATAYGTAGEPVRVGVHGDETGVHLEVRNRGVEISPEASEQLFNPLQRGAGERSRGNQEGLGLGLYIVKEITRARRGEVEARSEAGETIFSVRLPRR
jgi:hypothetical protein